MTELTPMQKAEARLRAHLASLMGDEYSHLASELVLTEGSDLPVTGWYQLHYMDLHVCSVHGSGQFYAHIDPNTGRATPTSDLVVAQRVIDHNYAAAE